MMFPFLRVQKIMSALKSWGEKRTFDFPFKNHVELNEKLKLV